MMKWITMCCMLLFPTPGAQAQTDSAWLLTDTPVIHHKVPIIKPTAFIVPAAAIAYGCLSLESDALKRLDTYLQSSFLYKSQPFRLDDYIQYLPAVSVYALNLAGIKGKHNLRDRSMLLGMSMLLTFGTTKTLKYALSRQRPDGSAYNSFPSGHTATAFAGATFLWMEYKDTHPWYGVAGYAVATGTAMLRMYNNRHWFSDVVMGAGLGMLNTRLAYWLYPSLQRLLFKEDSSGALLVVPFASAEVAGLSMQWQF